MDERTDKIKHWLRVELNLTLRSLEPASSDASFRRYFRAVTDDTSYIVMDAPPDKEPVTPFIKFASALLQQGVHTPTVISSNVANGFVLLEDLGNDTYLDQLRDDPEALYCAAVQSLIRLQRGVSEQPVFDLPVYDEHRLREEMSLFVEWFLKKHLNNDVTAESQSVFDDSASFLIEQCLQQPQVWVHRDYHSRNLMITARNSPGVIDFQDMVVGPITYDLASLYKDCYIEWPRSRQLTWLAAYWEQAIPALGLDSVSLKTVTRWYDMTGLQRHLKVLGVFCRLFYRDNKAHYLNDLPLVAKYILEVLDLYPELSQFSDTFRDHIASVA